MWHILFSLIASTHLESGLNGCLGVNRFESLLMGTNRKRGGLACCMLATNKAGAVRTHLGLFFHTLSIRVVLRAAHPVPNAQRLTLASRYHKLMPDLLARPLFREWQCFCSEACLCRSWRSQIHSNDASLQEKTTVLCWMPFVSVLIRSETVYKWLCWFILWLWVSSIVW